MASIEYEFGNYRYVVQDGTVLSPPALIKNGVELTAVAYSPKMSRLLTFLIQNHATPIKNLTAMKHVWGSGVAALRNHESSFTELVERLRTVFADTTRPHRFIERRDGEIQFVCGPITMRKIEGSSARPADSDAPQPRYFVTPADEDDIRWAAALAKEVYKGLDVIEESVMLDWYRANRHGFSIITAQEKRVGNLDILPLRPHALEDFKNGLLLEKNIRPEFIYPPSESDQITDLYIESFVCRNLLAVPVVLSEFRSLAGRICNPDRLQHILAIAASAEGVNLLADLGFRVVGSAQGHDLYSCTRDDLFAELQSVAQNFQSLISGRLRRLGDSDRPSAL